MADDELAGLKNDSLNELYQQVVETAEAGLTQGAHEAANQGQYEIMVTRVEPACMDTVAGWKFEFPDVDASTFVMAGLSSHYAAYRTWSDTLVDIAEDLEDIIEEAQEVKAALEDLGAAEEEEGLFEIGDVTIGEVMREQREIAADEREEAAGEAGEYAEDAALAEGLLEEEGAGSELEGLLEGASAEEEGAAILEAVEVVEVIVV